jgi:membrane fusion protein (multidrug efflux system)
MRNAAVLVAIALVIGGCSPKPPPAAHPPAVKFITVRPHDVPIFGEYIGTLEGYINAQIRAQVPGYVRSWNYREGTFVRKGSLLFEIDRRPFVATLERAKGTVGQAKAELEKTRIDVQRYQPLAARGSISREDLDHAVQANNAARAQLFSARGALREAEVNLGFTRILSPIDGIAGLAAAQVGDLVGPNTPPLTTVSMVDPIKVLFTMGEQDYLSLRESQDPNGSVGSVSPFEDLQMILSTGRVYEQRGRFYATQREVDSRTGAIQFVGVFANPGNVLRPGQFARVRARIGYRKGALTIPQRALIDLQGLQQVAVVDDRGVVHLRGVQLGVQYENEWVVEKGVQPEDRVVVEGLQKLREGASVVSKPYVPTTTSAPPHQPTPTG